jgi:glycosyltransferase involved in cell wall biosynthesis
MRLIVKLDANVPFLERVAADWRASRFWNRPFRQSFYYRKLLQVADAVICETSGCERILRDGFLGLDLGDKLVKTFSGVSEKWLASLGVAAFAGGARENRIIVAGRLSIWVKYTSLIFDAGPPPPGWTIDFIGEVDDEFQRVVDTYRAADPRFDEHYRFHGAITDKKIYYDLLMNARALLMNSRGPEGFPNVYADAHLCRLLIVTADIPSSYDATGDGRWGIIYQREDAEALRAALAALPAEADRYDRDADVEPFRQAFIWESSLAHSALERLFSPGQPELERPTV